MSTTTTATRVYLEGRSVEVNDGALMIGDRVGVAGSGTVTGIDRRPDFNGRPQFSYTVSYDVVSVSAKGQSVTAGAEDLAGDLADESSAVRNERELIDGLRRLRAAVRSPWTLTVAMLILAVACFITADILQVRAMTRCQAQFATQFNGQPDGRAVWSSAACEGLSTSDKAKVYARTVVTYQEAAERR